MFCCINQRSNINPTLSLNARIDFDKESMQKVYEAMTEDGRQMSEDRSQNIKGSLIWIESAINSIFVFSQDRLGAT